MNDTTRSYQRRSLDKLKLSRGVKISMTSVTSMRRTSRANGSNQGSSHSRLMLNKISTSNNNDILVLASNARHGTRLKTTSLLRSRMGTRRRSRTSMMMQRFTNGTRLHGKILTRKRTRTKYATRRLQISSRLASKLNGYSKRRHRMKTTRSRTKRRSSANRGTRGRRVRRDNRPKIRTHLYSRRATRVNARARMDNRARQILTNSTTRGIPYRKRNKRVRNRGRGISSMEFVRSRQSHYRSNSSSDRGSHRVTIVNFGYFSNVRLVTSSRS